MLFRSGACQQGVLVLGGAEKVVNGMEQRDAGIKVGADGCTTIVIRDGVLMIPPDWNMDEKTPFSVEFSTLSAIISSYCALLTIGSFDAFSVSAAKFVSCAGSAPPIESLCFFLNTI